MNRIINLLPNYYYFEYRFFEMEITIAYEKENIVIH